MESTWRFPAPYIDLSFLCSLTYSIYADAYERLILDCINGDRRLFIRADELEVAWEKFTPVLNEIEERGVQPELYPYGSRGPVGAHYLAAKFGVRWGDLAEEDTDL